MSIAPGNIMSPVNPLSPPVNDCNKLMNIPGTNNAIIALKIIPKYNNAVAIAELTLPSVIARNNCLTNKIIETKIFVVSNAIITASPIITYSNDSASKLMYEPYIPNTPSPGIVISRHCVVTVEKFFALDCSPDGAMLYA